MPEHYNRISVIIFPGISIPFPQLSTHRQGQHSVTIQIQLGTALVVIKLSKSQLVDKPKCQLCVLQHMVEAEKINLVLRGVDFIVRVLEIRLDDEGRWVSSLGCGSVVGTCIPAFCEDVRDVAILTGD